jgi:hypothetical protein
VRPVVSSLVIDAWRKKSAAGWTSMPVSAPAPRGKPYTAGFAAQPGSAEGDGDAVLTYTVSCGHVSTVRLLLSLGANSNPRPNSHGQTPDRIAQSRAWHCQVSVGHPAPQEATAARSRLRFVEDLASDA